MVGAAAGALGQSSVRSGSVRPAARSAAALALAALLAGCGRGGGAELRAGTGNASTTSTPGGTAPPTTGPGLPTTAPAPDLGPPQAGRSAPEPRPAPTGPPRSPLGDVQLRLTRIAGFDQPVGMAARPGEGGLYIAEKGGSIRAIRGGAVDPDPVLDISGDVSTGTEQGLLGLAFSPDGGRLYLNYTDLEGDTHIVEYAMSGGNADPDTRREVLFVDQPFANNNGGHLAFGPDGRLWIGMGDGGSGGDPQDNAQSLGSLLGKMLRIDPRPSGGAAYTSPPDNPLAGGGARPEIWAYGLRNPWRFSFDRATGDLWIGDVGQNASEEIDYQPAGAGGQNYGWARLEGTRQFSGRPPSDAVAPFFEYERVGGNCSVTGGYVYRGARIPALVGVYVFADFCAGQLRALRQSGGQLVDERTFSNSVRSLSSFGQDNAGELYALSLQGGVFRIDPG